MIRGIPAAEYWSHKDKIRPFLENFAQRSYDGWTVDDLEQGIIDRERQVWCINEFQALCLTHVTPASVRVDACAGVRRKEWQDDLDQELKRWAKALGKKWVIGLVRPGWTPFAKARGYKEIHRELVIEV